jgi:hypothetical protein
MPNGQLSSHYGTKVLKAGKNPDKTRFNFSKVPMFELLDKPKSRVKVVYFDNSMDDGLKKSLKFYKKIYDKQVEF